MAIESYKAQSGSKTRRSIRESNPSTLEYKTVTLANTPRKSHINYKLAEDVLFKMKVIADIYHLFIIEEEIHFSFTYCDLLETVHG